MNVTPQERIALLYILLGYTDKEIAKKMKISYATVRTYLMRGTLKLSARNSTHAAFKYLLKLSPEVYLETVKELQESL